MIKGQITRRVTAEDGAHFVDVRFPDESVATLPLYAVMHDEFRQAWYYSIGTHVLVSPEAVLFHNRRPVKVDP